jgi:carbamoyltransferase
MVRESWNPRYYAIIKEFEKLTGIGGVLNTSFNLHGKPIVSTPQDAVEEVFEHSGLKHVIIGDVLLTKR